MVYQEDVIKVAHHFAGLDLADADTLRRGMSGKFRSKAEFAKIREKFFDSCARKGYSVDVTTEVQGLVQNGEIDFVVSAQSLGIPDPNPGSSDKQILQIQHRLNGGHKNLHKFIILLGLDIKKLIDK
jgi:hypothetical protein